MACLITQTVDAEIFEQIFQRLETSVAGIFNDQKRGYELKGSLQRLKENMMHHQVMLLQIVPALERAEYVVKRLSDVDISVYSLVYDSNTMANFIKSIKKSITQ